jgi:hypothetical protein
MRQKGHILKAPQLGIELLERGGGSHHRDARILRSSLAQQAAGVNQALAGVEVELDACHGYTVLAKAA